MNTEDLAARVRTGDRKAVAEALNLVENVRDDAKAKVQQLLALLRHDDDEALRVGVTGPPGAGKSTLCGVLATELRKRDLRVALVAVDPSSTRTGGSLLGDRIRTAWDPTDEGLFARSIATGGALGGLSNAVPAAVRVLGCAFDIVLVETTGVGQTELHVRDVADIVLVVAQPGSGDALQGIKAGIMEIPDFLVVNKADLGETAERSARELERSTMTPVLRVSAAQGTGIDDLVEALLATERHTFAKARLRGELAWIFRQFRNEFGAHGVRLLGGEDAVKRSIETCLRESDSIPAIHHLEWSFFETMSRKTTPFSQSQK
ncbi:MAG: LAO/AO transport system kinase [Polyangiales bacterium]|jgi:LAO/AO transport system kinase